MPIVKCPGCDVSIKCPTERIGSQVKCPKCERVFIVPWPDLPQAAPPKPKPKPQKPKPQLTPSQLDAALRTLPPHPIVVPPSEVVGRPIVTRSSGVVGTKYCRTCQRWVATVPTYTPNHVAHLIAVIFLCGLWLPFWLFACFLSMIQGRRCQYCGR